MWISALVLWIGGTWLVAFLASTTLLSLGLSQSATPIMSIAVALYVGVILPVFANYLYYSSVGQRITHLRMVWNCGYHTPAGVDAHNAAAGPDLTNIAPKYLPTECKKHFWDSN